MYKVMSCHQISLQELSIFQVAKTDMTGKFRSLHLCKLDGGRRNDGWKLPLQDWNVHNILSKYFAAMLVRETTLNNSNLLSVCFVSETIEGTYQNKSINLHV